MNLPRRTLLVAALFLVPAPLLYAQIAADPSGHWDGAIQAPGKEVKFEVDLAKNSKGELAGTFSNPAQNIKGYPLTNVAVEGRSIHFLLKVNSGGGPFDGVLSADGKSIAGDFTAATAQGNFTVPFSLSLSPGSGGAGTTITVSGTGFLASEGITVGWDHTDNQVATATANGSGAFSTSFAPRAVPGITWSSPLVNRATSPSRRRLP